MIADDVYRVDGSKVWLSPTARELAAMHFREEGDEDHRAAERRMADYLRTRQRLAALSPSNIGADVLAPWRSAPGGIPQEYEASTGDAQQEQQAPPPDMVLPDDGLPTYRPID